MDERALFKITYGLFIASATYNGADGGCIVNTLQQVTNMPNQLAVTVSKDNYTCALIEKSGFFGAVALNQDADMELIGRFGFQTGKNVKKYQGISFLRDKAGVPYLTQAVSARYTCRVNQKMDLGTHVLFVGEVTEAEITGEALPLTYTYYRDVIKGGTPKNAPSYHGPEAAAQVQETKTGAKKYQCEICGYIHEGEAPAAGFECPICGAPGEKFTEL